MTDRVFGLAEHQLTVANQADRAVTAHGERFVIFGLRRFRSGEP